MGAAAFLALASCGNKEAVIMAQRSFDRGDYDLALRQMKSTDPSYLEAQLLKARAYEAKGDKATARTYYADLVQSHPGSAEGIVARNRLRAL